MGSKNFFETVGSRKKHQTTFFGLSATAETFKKLFWDRRQLPKASNNFFWPVGSCRNLQKLFLASSATAESSKQLFLPPRQLPNYSLTNK